MDDERCTCEGWIDPAKACRKCAGNEPPPRELTAEERAIMREMARLQAQSTTPPPRDYLTSLAERQRALSEEELRQFVALRQFLARSAYTRRFPACPCCGHHRCGRTGGGLLGGAGL